MSPPITLVAVLDAYSSTALSAMRAHWLGKGRAPDKQSCIRELVGLLTDEAGVVGAVGALDTDQRLVLYQLEQIARPTLANLRTAVSSLGVRDVDQVVVRLARAGLLLALPLAGTRVLEFGELWDHPERALAVLPLARGRLPPPPMRKERLPTIDPSKVLALRSPDPGRLVRAMLGLAAIAERRKLKLTAGGWISATHLSVLERELSLDEALPLLFVIEVALCAGLVMRDDGLLRAGDGVGQSASVSLSERIGQAWRAFLDEGRWWDDQPNLDSAETLNALRAPPWGEPALEQAAAARQSVVGVLSRLRVEGWMTLDALVDLVLEHDPGLLIRPLRREWSYSRAVHIPPVSPYPRAMQRNAAAAFVARTAFAFGLVDLGTTTGSFPDFDRPSRRHAHWDAWQDPEHVRYREEERKKPRWVPTPSGVVFRVTPIGQQILWGRATAQATPEGPGLRIGPDFEIVALLDQAPAEALYQLELVARAIPGHAADRARRFRLEKDRWIAALRSGVEAAPLLEQLVAWSGRPLPENVARTLQDWTGSFGLVSVHVGLDLVEFASSAERARRLAETTGEPVGDRYALVPQGALEGGTLFDYAGPRVRCLDVGVDGTLSVVAAQADLLVEAELGAFAEGAPPRRVTAASVRASRWSTAEILHRLEHRARAGVPSGLALAIRGWRGEVAPLPLAAATLLQVADPAIAEAILSRPDLAEHLAGAVAPTVLLVRQGRRAALQKALGALGIAVDDALQVS